MRARLMCRVGEHRGYEREFAQSVVIGSGSDCEVSLAVPGLEARHAEIRWNDERGRYVLRDLGSASGTRIDGIAVRGLEALGSLHVLTLSGLSLVFQDLSTRNVGEDDAATVPAERGPDAAAPMSTEIMTAPSIPTALRMGGAATPVRAFLEVTIDGRHERFELAEGPNLIGRSRADIRLPTREVSRRHATVTLRDGRLLVRDEGSTNGTWLRGERIAGEVLVPPGSPIGFGSIEARLVLEPADGSPAPGSRRTGETP